ncbi:UNVERIFIED_CONTAM: hypothetical protein HDU68_005013 [Siphonaria sp. JEL0065]|nr:hypothetical protein HDU68_005013 [Siphonaria sp. JEL0065]
MIGIGNMSHSFPIALLDRSNWDVWTRRMCVMLSDMKLWDFATIRPTSNSQVSAKLIADTVTDSVLAEVPQNAFVSGYSLWLALESLFNNGGAASSNLVSVLPEDSKRAATGTGGVPCTTCYRVCGARIRGFCTFECARRFCQLFVLPQITETPISNSPPSATGVLKFYNRGEPLYELTNFYEESVLIDNHAYPTTEHYFQSQKFVPQYSQLADQIRRASTARIAFDIAQANKNQTRNDWHSEHVKIHVMFYALVSKFDQSDQLGRVLLSTGDRTLIEHSPYDGYWGDKVDGSGFNVLGQLLMHVRGLFAMS